MALVVVCAALLASVPPRPIGKSTCGACNVSPPVAGVTPATSAVRNALNGARSTKAFPRLFMLQTMQFDGGMMGVKATVLLDRRSESAIINLRGLPVGGSLSGMAWFKKDGESVEVETDLYHALARRGVSIVSAGAYKDYSSIWVRVKMPLGMGTIQMVLPRIKTNDAIYAN